MATYYSSWSSYGDLRVRLKITTYYTQSKANNTSTVTINEYIETKTDFAAPYYTYTWDHKLTHTGVTYSEPDRISFGTATSDWLVQSSTRTINHSSTTGEGSFSFSASAKWSEAFAGKSGTLSIGTTYVTLPKINRTSSIKSDATSSAGKQFGEAVKFTITRPSGTSYKHTLSYKVNDTTYTIASNTSNTSIEYVFPEDLVSSFPKNEKVSITITCKSENGTSSTTTAYLTVPSSYVPTCDLTLEECGVVPTAWGVYVKTKSKIKGTTTANGSGGSTITNYTSTGNKQTFYTPTFETGYLTSAGEGISFTTTVKDSRGRPAISTKAIEVLEYSSPTIVSVMVQRCLEDGTINEDGTFGKCTIEYSISAINNGTTNLNTKEISVSLGTETKTATLPEYQGTYTFDTLFANLDTKSSYDFDFVLTDYFSSTPQAFQLAPSFVTRSYLAGGKGMTLGRTAVEEGFHSYMDNAFHKKTYMEQQNIKGLITIKSGNVYIRYIEEE